MHDPTNNIVHLIKEKPKWLYLKSMLLLLIFIILIFFLCTLKFADNLELIGFVKCDKTCSIITNIPIKATKYLKKGEKIKEDMIINNVSFKEVNIEEKVITQKVEITVNKKELVNNEAITLTIKMEEKTILELIFDILKGGDENA